MDYKRVINSWPVVKEGLPFIVGGLGITFLFLWLGCTVLSILAALITLFAAFFFRDPERLNELPPGGVFSPADGTVLEIIPLDKGDNLYSNPTIKLSIFMSLFDVHVNRIPLEAEVKDIAYEQGKFFAANSQKASTSNENNRLLLGARGSRDILLVQIAGLIARRIACWVDKGDIVTPGQRFGLIRFGSRVEIYLPLDSHITVKEGQKVKAGETILGYLS